MSESAEHPKHYLLAHIRETLAKDPRVSELNVEASLAGTKVVLTGYVSTSERKEAISEVVRELLPGYQVSNQTVVRTYPETTEVETLS